MSKKPTGGYVPPPPANQQNAPKPEGKVCDFPVKKGAKLVTFPSQKKKPQKPKSP